MAEFMGSIENFLFGGQRARIEKFQALPKWQQYLALLIGIVGGFFQVLASSLNNNFSTTLWLLAAKPVDNWRRWKALRSGRLYISFFD